MEKQEKTMRILMRVNMTLYDPAFSVLYRKGEEYVVTEEVAHRLAAKNPCAFDKAPKPKVVYVERPVKPKVKEPKAEPKRDKPEEKKGV